MKIALLVLSILFILLVLIQQKNSSLGSMMGQDSGDQIIQTRRGVEKVIHRITIIVAILLFAGAFYLMIQG